MQRLDLVGTLTGVRFAVPTGQVEIVSAGTVAAPRWQVINHVTRETVTLSVVAGAMGSQTGLSVHGSDRVALTVDGVAGSVLTDAVGAAVRLDGDASVTTFLSGSSPSQGQMVELLATDAGASTWVYAARPAGSGIAILELGPNGTLTPRGTVPDTAGTAAATISAMTAATIGTAQVLYTGSAGEHGVQAWAIGAGGALTALGVQGSAQGVPMQGVTALRSVVLDGQTYVIAAAAGSSSLTVFQAGSDGRLTVADHVIDDLGTRFANVTVIDTIEVDGRIFMVAGGADEGFSLFTMAPGGRLVHLQALADTAAMGLANVSAVEMVRVGSEVQVLVASGAEAGVTLLRINLAGLGQVIAASAPTQTGSAAADLMFRMAGQGVLEGGAGDDILIDGTGLDELRGGAGGDMFILTADGRRDVIRDFEPAADMIDLSQWPFLRSTGQLQVTSTATGAVVTFGAEVLEIFTASGTSLTVAQVLAMAVPPVSRVPFGEAAGQGKVIEGTSGADTLTGGTGDDTILGRGGSDLMYGGDGADQYNGGAGNDTVSFAQATGPVTIDLGQPALNGGAAAGEVFGNVEAFIGTALGDTMTGGADAVSLYGGGGGDVLTGGAGADLLDGGTGGDTLAGGAGADTLSGGGGTDTLTYEGEASAVQINLSQPATNAGAAAGDGIDGVEVIIGTALGDRIVGDTLANTFHGGDGDDWLEGGAGTDVLYGGFGDDSVKGGNDGDTLYGGDGDDILPAEFGNDLVYGDEGNDEIGGGDGADTLYGGGGQDVIGAGSGVDRIYGDDGDDVTSGGWGNDLVFGGAGSDTMAGSYGNDSVDGGEGDDMLGGGLGTDTIDGGAGNDLIGSGDDDDLLLGGAGNDFLGGGAGNDVLMGGTGLDKLNGGLGNDTMRGDGGADTFVFAAFTAGEADVVEVFENGEDRLQMTGIPGAGAAGKFAALDIDTTGIGGTTYVRIQHDGHVILLSGITQAALDVSDFIWV